MYTNQSAVGSFVEPLVVPTQTTSTCPADPATSHGSTTEPVSEESVCGADHVVPALAEALIFATLGPYGVARSDQATYRLSARSIAMTGKMPATSKPTGAE
jgi:hypothetical protein